MINETLISALRQILDPEIGLDIVSLGLLYQIETSAADTKIIMTTTSPACPMGEYLRSQVEATAGEIAAGSIEVTITHDPPWNAAMMDEHAKARLGWH